MSSARIILLLCFLAAIAATGCAKSPYTGRNQLMLVSPQQETQLGLQARNQVLETAKMSTDAAQVDRVTRIGRKIAQATGRTDYQWEFFLVDDPKQVNAFALPGGKVFVYTGMLNLTTTNKELATVMAHEIAHVLARHGAERMSVSMAAQMGGQIGAAALGASSGRGAADLFAAAYGMGAQVGVVLPFSREQETEADHIGLILMAKAGYDPAAAVNFWRKMKAQGGAAPPEWLSTHPTDDTRINNIQAALPEIRRKYYRGP